MLQQRLTYNTVLQIVQNNMILHFDGIQHISKITYFFRLLGLPLLSIFFVSISLFKHGLRLLMWTVILVPFSSVIT